MIPVVVGSSPIAHPKFGWKWYRFAQRGQGCAATFQGPLAQLVEQLTLNQLVEGSSPSRPTNATGDRQPAGLRFFLPGPGHGAARSQEIIAAGTLFPVSLSVRGFTVGPGSASGKSISGVRYRESGGIGRRAGFRFQWGNP